MTDTSTVYDPSTSSSGGILGWLGDFLGLNKGKGTEGAASANQNILTQLQQTGGGYLDQANQNSQNLLGQAQSGATMYANALGLNGAAGNTAATSAFQTNPGYEFSLDQGENALERTAASRGQLASGQSGIDLQNYGINTADNAYQQWLGNLAPYNSELSGATSGANTSLDNLTDFAGTIAGGQSAANNQAAAGQEAGQGGLWNILGNIAGIAGTVSGLNKTPTVPGAQPAAAPAAGPSYAPSFGSYGSF